MSIRIARNWPLSLCGCLEYRDLEVRLFQLILIRSAIITFIFED